MVCQLYFTMDFGIGCELVHPSVTMVQILRAVGLMAAIIAGMHPMQAEEAWQHCRSLKETDPHTLLLSYSKESSVPSSPNGCLPEAAYPLAAENPTD